jgi:hypothetical protein
MHRKLMQRQKNIDDITANYNSKKNSYFKFSFGSGVNGKVIKRTWNYYVQEINTN